MRIALRKQGLANSKADVVVHVCFDNYKWSETEQAPCMWIYTPKAAVEAVANKPKVYGSRAGSSVKNTGKGGNPTPTELGAKFVKFEIDPTLYIELGERGKVEAMRVYKARGWRVWLATEKEDIRQGFDFWASSGQRTIKVEVKSRGEDKAYKGLFVQTHEANLDKRIT